MSAFNGIVRSRPLIEYDGMDDVPAHSTPRAHASHAQAALDNASVSLGYFTHPSPKALREWIGSPDNFLLQLSPYGVFFPGAKKAKSVPWLGKAGIAALVAQTLIRDPIWAVDPKPKPKQLLKLGEVMAFLETKIDIAEHSSDDKKKNSIERTADKLVELSFEVENKILDLQTENYKQPHEMNDTYTQYHLAEVIEQVRKVNLARAQEMVDEPDGEFVAFARIIIHTINKHQHEQARVHSWIEFLEQQVIHFLLFPESIKHDKPHAVKRFMHKLRPAFKRRASELAHHHPAEHNRLAHKAAAMGFL